MGDYFGFNESRDNISGLNTKPGSTNHGLYSTFRCDKPYRLALYGIPNIKRRRLEALNATRCTLNSTRNTTQKSNESLTITHNISLDKANVSEEAEVVKPTRRKNNTKINNKENEGRNKKTKTAPKKKEEVDNAPAVEIRQSGRLIELNGKKSTNIQKSDEKQLESILISKENKGEFLETSKKCVTFAKKGKVKEPTHAAATDETIEVKKRPSVTYTRNKSKPKEPARTKQKDTTKTKHKMPKAEEEEFEKWAASLNKEFDEVENFDLSVNYD